MTYLDDFYAAIPKAHHLGEYVLVYGTDKHRAVCTKEYILELEQYNILCLIKKDNCEYPFRMKVKSIKHAKQLIKSGEFERYYLADKMK